MANDLNGVCMVGRLTRDMELSTTKGGTSVGKFSLATNRWNGKEQAVSFFDCTMWGKRAESLAQYMTKGTQVAVHGELVQDRWEKDGQARSRVYINVRDVQMLNRKTNDVKSLPSEDDGDSDDDSIPF